MTAPEYDYVDERAQCPDCGLEEHPHQTCAEANITDQEALGAILAEALAKAPE